MSTKNYTSGTGAGTFAAGDDIRFTQIATNTTNLVKSKALAADQAILAGFTFTQPYILSSPPSVTAGTANAASAISGSVQFNAYESGCYTFLGGIAKRGYQFPNYTGLSLGSYPGITSASPTAVEFWLDTIDATGRFEINMKGNGQGVRVAIQQNDRSWGYASQGSTFTPPSDGNGYRHLVTLGVSGRYKIRLEFSGGCYFYGIQAGPNDTITATRKPLRKYIVVGDSFTEPTISDSGATNNWDGWVGQLSYLTGLDIWSAGSGGTGYLQTNPGSSRPKFRDRLVGDILSQNPDGIIWAGGINDYGNYTASAIGAEALACFQQVQAFNPKIDQIVLSPFFPRSQTIQSTGNLLMTRDAIASAANTVGAKFLDLLSLPIPDYLGIWSSTLQANAASSATSLSVASIPAYSQQANAGNDGWYVYIGNSTTSEIRKVSNISGTGPYTLSLANSLTSAHTSGEPITLSGRQYMTGIGRQGTTTGSGNADLYTGSDATHPTRLGHHHIARTVAHLWSLAISSQ